jgi:hypothetical protein
METVTTIPAPLADVLIHSALSAFRPTDADADLVKAGHFAYTGLAIKPSVDGMACVTIITSGALLTDNVSATATLVEIEGVFGVHLAFEGGSVLRTVDGYGGWEGDERFALSNRIKGWH